MNSGYTCPCCTYMCSDIKSLCSHMRDFHVFSGYRTDNKVLKCGQDGCQQTFDKLCSWRRHILQCHEARHVDPHGETFEQTIQTKNSDIETVSSCSAEIGCNGNPDFNHSKKELSEFMLSPQCKSGVTQVSSDFSDDAIPCNSYSSSTKSSSTGLALNVSLHQELARKPNGPELLEALDTSNLLKPEYYRRFIKYSVEVLNDLGCKAGCKKWYPSSTLKKQMASLMVHEFPLLSKDNDENSAGKFYDGHGNGFIENRLRTIRKNLPYSQKAYKRRTAKRRCLEKSAYKECTDSALQSKMNWLKNNVTSQSNNLKVVAYMNDTFEERMKFINSVPHPSAFDILMKFPRYIDTFCGELLQIDFKRLFPSARDITEWLPDYSSKILKIYKKRQHPDIQEATDENMKAVLCLEKLLPAVNAFVKDSVIVECVKGETDPKEYASQHNYMKPFLMCWANEGSLSCYIIIDQTAIPVGSNFLSAFEKLYCCFWVFKLKYPTARTAFYSFFDVSCSIGVAKPSATLLLTQIKKDNK